MSRCRKHCLHTVTPHCRVCCQCGRGVNTRETLDPMRVGNWEPRSKHGPHLIAAMLESFSTTGSTHMVYRGHPYAYNYPVTPFSH